MGRMTVVTAVTSNTVTSVRSALEMDSSGERYDTALIILTTKMVAE